MSIPTSMLTGIDQLWVFHRYQSSGSASTHEEQWVGKQLIDMKQCGSGLHLLNMKYCGSSMSRSNYQTFMWVLKPLAGNVSRNWILCRMDPHVGLLQPKMASRGCHIKMYVDRLHLRCLWVHALSHYRQFYIMWVSILKCIVQYNIVHI